MYNRTIFNSRCIRIGKVPYKYSKIRNTKVFAPSICSQLFYCSFSYNKYYLLACIILSQYTSDLRKRYAEKRPALAAAGLIRMEGLDFSRQFSSPAAESLARCIIMVSTVQYVLQYIIGTWYLVPVPSRYGRTPNFYASEMQLLPQDRPGPDLFFEPQ